MNKSVKKLNMKSDWFLQVSTMIKISSQTFPYTFLRNASCSFWNDLHNLPTEHHYLKSVGRF